MRVSHRLLLTLLPAFFGLLTVVGLAYWGQYARQAPHVAVVAAAIALGASILLALRNARYLAQRIERLAAAAPPGARDELDSIERSVEHLQTEVTSARAEGERQHQALVTERTQLTQLVGNAAAVATRAIDDVRLPLHILLENRFGDLNENQEEMLGAAQAAADEASALFHRLRLLAALEQGTVTLRRDAIRVDDLLRTLLPTVEGMAEQRAIRVSADIPPGLPRVVGDRTHLQEALAIALRGAIGRTTDQGAVHIALERSSGGVHLLASHGTGELDPLEATLLVRILRAMQATLLEEEGRSVIELPVAVAPAVPGHHT